MYHIMRRAVIHLIPPPCACCGDPVVHSAEPLCAGCWGALHLAASPKRIQISFAGDGTAWLPYGTPTVKRCMAAIKFRGLDTLAVALGRVMAQNLDRPTVDALVPIPLAASRLYVRGYNQAERLAHGLHQVWGIPLASDMLIRPNAGWFTPKQSARSEADRSKIYGAYDVRDRGRWAGARLALVDDTFTTGSTLNAAAEVCIKKAKVAEVIPLTLAYTARRAT